MNPFLIVAALLSVSAGSCNTIERPCVTCPPHGADTTSHDFVWESNVVGEGNSSVLHDVAIIDENNIWAVGELFLRDSIGQVDPTMYNLAIWNGTGWNLQRLYYPFGGSQFIAPLHSILSFGQNDVWVASNQPMHWNGSVWETFNLESDIWNGWVNKMWGSSGMNVFLVGAAGAIAHFDGSSWTRVESGTAVDLVDVWGNADGTDLWACGFLSNNSESVLLHSTGQTWSTVWHRQGTAPRSPFEYFVTSIWSGPFIYCATGRGVHRIDRQRSDTAKVVILPWFPYRVRGVADNDIAVVGDNAMVWHWNGASWKEVYMGTSAQTFYSVAVTRDQIVAVGADYSSISSTALIVRAKRMR